MSVIVELHDGIQLCVQRGSTARLKKWAVVSQKNIYYGTLQKQLVPS